MGGLASTKINEIAISTAFFDEAPADAREEFSVSIEAKNGDDMEGLYKMDLKVNKPPHGGWCQIEPKEGYSLVTDFEFLCDGWTDPEDPTNLHQKKYVVSRRVEMT